MRTRSHLLAFLLTGFAFVAGSCQPSSGSSDLGVGNTGRLVDPVIAGLAWSTPSRSGITGEDGSFRYGTGESITFHLGPFAIGEATPASAQMSVFDLLPGATPPTVAVDVRRLREQAASTVPDADLLAVYEASNLLATLYWFDADKQPANGIQLPTGIDTVLEGVPVAFRQASTRFHTREHQLRIAVFRASALGLLASARRIHPFVAIDRHQAARGVQPQLWIDAREQTDAGNNGTIDSVRTWTVDGRGFRVAAARDNDGNGTVDRYETSEFDDHGNLLGTATDNDGNGTVNRRTTREFDGNGLLVAERIDTDGNGAPNNIARYFHDDDGNLVRREFDDNADGTLDRIQIATFDAAGDLRRFDYDNGANGTIDRIETRTFDDRHNELLRTTDSNGDGVPDRSDRSEYDTAGNTTLRETDENGDGTVDSRVVSTWSAAGDLLVESQDFDADGTPDDILRREYDGKHRTTRYEHDQDGNGTIDELNVITYVDDALGNQILNAQDYGNNGSIDNRFVQEWSTDGRRTGSYFDVDGNGLYDLRLTFEQTRTTLLGTIVNG